jgi:hypothetical protein
VSRAVYVVGCYEIIGGIVGTLVTAAAAREHAAGIPGGSFFTASLPFAFLVTSGWLLVRGHRLGLLLSIGAQGAQVIGWSLYGSAWKLSAGLYVSAAIMNGNLGLSAGWETAFLVGWRTHGQPAAIAVNFAALALAVFLGWTLYKTSRVE